MFFDVTKAICEGEQKLCEVLNDKSGAQSPWIQI